MHCPRMSHGHWGSMFKSLELGGMSSDLRTAQNKLRTPTLKNASNHVHVAMERYLVHPHNMQGAAACYRLALSRPLQQRPLLTQLRLPDVQLRQINTHTRRQIITHTAAGVAGGTVVCLGGMGFNPITECRPNSHFKYMPTITSPG
jgi:hypothetical protein